MTELVRYVLDFRIFGELSRQVAAGNLLQMRSPRKAVVFLTF